MAAPPAMRTSPVDRRFRVRLERDADMSPAAEKLEVLSSNKIASAKDTGPDTQQRVVPPLTTTVCSPPARNTRPSGTSAAARCRDWVPPDAVGTNELYPGSNNSPRAVPLESTPPAISTLPVERSIAVW